MVMKIACLHEYARAKADGVERHSSLSAYLLKFRLIFRMDLSSIHVRIVLRVLLVEDILRNGVNRLVFENS